MACFELANVGERLVHEIFFDVKDDIANGWLGIINVRQSLAGYGLASIGVDRCKVHRHAQLIFRVVTHHLEEAIDVPGVTVLTGI